MPRTPSPAVRDGGEGGEGAERRVSDRGSVTLPRGTCEVDCLDDGLVTIPACLFGDSAVPLSYAKRIGIAAGREIERVPESVPRLRDVFADEIVRSVTLVARRVAVTSLLPRCEMLAHDVTVCACRRIVREI